MSEESEESDQCLWAHGFTWNGYTREHLLLSYCKPPVSRELMPAITLLLVVLHKKEEEADWAGPGAESRERWNELVSADLGSFEEAIDLLRDPRAILMPKCFGRCVSDTPKGWTPKEWIYLCRRFVQSEALSK